ncbi:MAG: restriction endonuclease subunit S [Hormoscilla sp. GUM202]|nr:restriction endonuclease subunit S [Hormoscilla sp. GUM202]
MSKDKLAIDNSQVPEGYKQTEVGVIPEDWDVKHLKNALKTTPQYGINAPAVPYRDNLPVYIRITDISESGYFAPEKLVSVNQENSDQYYLEEGDLVFARTGSVGKSYLYNPDDGELVFAGFLIRIRPDKNILLPHYLAQYVKTKAYWNWVKLMSMRSVQPGINGNEYGQLLVPLPAIEEQRAIAQTLSDVDGLIAALDKLIAKKRNIKTATMQELLTGKKRLPGFGDEWHKRKLSSLGIFKSGNGFPIKYQGLKTGSFPFFKVSDMNNKGNSVLMQNYNNWITKESQQELSATIFPKGTIVFAKIGAAIFLERKKQLAIASCIDNNMMGFILNDEADSSFIHQLLLTVEFGSLVNTTALPSLSGKELSELTFCFPNTEEQRAIASILSDMDAEIAALEKRRAKTQAMKQGMMQELLTGKTRLIVPNHP